MKPARFVRREIPADAEILSDSRWHPVLRRIYAARGVISGDTLDLKLGRLSNPASLSGLPQACELLAQAIEQQQSILIVGDFDADGATGTAVAMRGLKLLGAKCINFRVPNRFVHGYGLSAELVGELAVEPPDVLVTVDSGIACHAGVNAAKLLGCKVIITDHHLPGESLPLADAIVNPNISGDAFPSKALAGVGVMFYLLLALRAHLRGLGYFNARRSEPDLSSLLDLVAIGTVADLVPLDYNNRVLVAAGLRRINSSQACAGVEAIIRASGRDSVRIDASDLGFVVGPRINAAGRLEDMSLGIACLTSDDPAHSLQLAEQLNAINAERREVQADMVAQAELWLQKYHPENTTLPAGMCLFDADWHPGVIGLLASRIKDRVQRPVIIFAPANEDSDELKGSARSITGLNVRDLLAEINVRYPGLMGKFGGHAMAAGLNLPHRSHFERFASAFNAVVQEHADPVLFDACVHTDGALESTEISLLLAEALRAGGPWGQAFPEPLFDGEFGIETARIMGERHLSLRLRCTLSNHVFDAVYFNGFTGALPTGHWRYAYQLFIDEWRHQRRLRLMIRHAEPVQ